MYRRSNALTAASMAVATLLLAGGPAAAIDINALPYTITAPGTYHVTQDLSTPTDGIIIQASNVRVYLNGHTLNGNQDGAGVKVGAFSNVLVQGGTFVNFDTGVFLDGTTSATLASLTARGVSFSLGFVLANVRNSALLNCTSINNDEVGISMGGGGGNTIRSCLVVDGGENGISLGGTSNNLIAGNKVQFVEVGIYLSVATNNLIQDNVVSFNQDEGIEIEGSSSNRIRTNWVESNGGQGISLIQSRSNTLELNRVSGNTFTGISLVNGSNTNTIVANTVLQNLTGIGLTGGSGNLVQNNTVTGNFGIGVWLQSTSANRIISNQVNGNTSIGLALDTSTRNTLQYNQVRNNNEEGITVSLGSTQNNILSNAATGNLQGDLYDLNPNCDQNTWSGNTFGTKNQACVK